MPSVPIAPLAVEAEIVRPGRNVELVRAKLSDADGEVIRAHAWRLRTAEVSFEEPPGRPETMPGPEQGQPGEFFHTGYDVGYHTAVEYRTGSASTLSPCPSETGSGSPTPPSTTRAARSATRFRRSSSSVAGPTRRRGRDSNPRTWRTRSTAFKAAAINQTLPPLRVRLRG
jgi:hypothetical protein